MKINDLVKRENYKYYVDWDVVDTIPEFQKLKTIEQSPEWHAEGNAYIHTRQVVDAAIKSVSDFELDYYQALAIIGSALFHDIGKICSTFVGEDGKIHSHGHEMASERLTRRILWEDKIFRESICNLIKMHMKCHDLKKFKQYPTFKKWITYFIENSTDLTALSLLHRADVIGSNYNPELKNLDVLHATNFYLFTLGEKTELKIKDLYLCYFVETSKVVLLIGLPGSGKSTFAEKLMGENDYEYISSDAIREELGFIQKGEKTVCGPFKEQKVTEVFNTRFKEALAAGKDIIVDNMNIKRRYRDDLKKMAEKYNVYWHYVYVEAPNLDINCDRRPMISKNIFETMIDGIEWPNLDEYNTLTIFNYENT